MTELVYSKRLGIVDNVEKFIGGYMAIKYVNKMDFKGKKVILRVDFNVPLDENQIDITDDTRIKESLPTINKILQEESKLILASHLGRPGGKVVEKLGVPMVTTSANKTGKPFMTKLENLDSDIEKEVEFMIYEGEKGGRPSQIVDLTGAKTTVKNR